MYSESGIHEECGVFGVIAPEPCDVANICYYGAVCPAAQRSGELRDCGKR